MPPKIKQNKNNNKGFNKLSDDVFPFACYYDEKTVITKNGHLMQTISIISHDNNANINGIFSENIKKAIKTSMGESYSDYSFWIHSVKITDETISSIVEQDKQGNALYSVIKEKWKNYKKTFNNYMVVTFITFIHTAMPLNIGIKNFMILINKSLLYRTHGIWIKKSAYSLTHVVDQVMNQLSQYTIKRLQIIKKNDQYDSEHLAFWDKIINFGEAEYGVPIINLSSIINRSLYKIEKDHIVVKNDQGKKYCMFFTLKDSNSISPSLVSDIVSKLKNIILTEFFHFETIANVKHSYAKQIMQLKKHIMDPSVIKIAGLSELQELDKDHNQFCRHYAGLVLICDSLEDLEEELKAMCEISIENGLVFGQEDVGTERAFYGIIPGNFRSIAHYNIVPFKDVCSLVNSHMMDNDNISEYINKEPICILPTMKKYPYAFGILEKKQDILISGPMYSEVKYMFSKILISFLSPEVEKICIIDISSSMKSFLDISDGKYYEIDNDKTDSSPTFSLFKIDNIGDIPSKGIMINIISMMIMAFGGRLLDKDLEEISDGIDKSGSIEEILTYITDDVLKIQLKKWQKEEQLGFLFDKGNDSLENTLLSDNKKIIGFNLNQNICKNRFIRCLLVYYIILKFISVADSTKRNLIVINNPIFLMDHHIFKLEWELINKTAREKNIYFMFLNNDTLNNLIAEKTKFSIKNLLANCDTQFHFGGTVATEEYGESYNLNSGEIYAINGISSILNAAILKQNGIILPISLELDCIDEIITDILQDGIVIREKINDISKTISDPKKILKQLIENDANEKKVKSTEQEESDANKAEKDADMALQILSSA